MMQVGFMMYKALDELFILKSTKPLPIIFKTLQNFWFSVNNQLWIRVNYLQTRPLK